MRKDNLEQLNKVFDLQKEKNKKYKEKIEREKAEILKYIRFNGCKKELKSIDNIEGKSEFITQPIEAKTLRDGLKGKYDVIFADFYDSNLEILGLPNIWEYVILQPCREELTPFVVIIHTLYHNNISYNNKLIRSEEKGLYFAIKRGVSVISMLDDVEDINDIKKLKNHNNFNYKDVFNEDFIIKYIEDYVSNINVALYCDESLETVSSTLDFFFNKIGFDIAKSISKKINRNEIDKDYKKKIKITDDVYICINCEDVIGDISFEVKELPIHKKVSDIDFFGVEQSQNHEKISFIDLKQKVTKITITYTNGKEKESVDFISHGKIYKEGNFKKFLEM